MAFLSGLLRSGTVLKPLITRFPLKSFHTIVPSSFLPPSLSQRFLAPPQLPLVIQTCGFKVKVELRRRCKDCYFVVRDGRTYVICPTHPRHKQMSKRKKLKYTWILTHASQSKIRPY